MQMKNWVVTLLGVSLSMSGCGDHDVRSAIERAELIQDVRLIDYSLKSANWTVNVDDGIGNVESLEKRSRFQKSQSKDKVQRVFDEGRFLLMTNDRRLNVTMNPEGRFKEVRDFSQDFADGCRVQGGATLQGEATHLRLDLSWEWNAKLLGDGCPESAQNQFGEFVQAELARLNLRSASDLLVGLDQGVQRTRSISMKLKLLGEIDLDQIDVSEP